MAQFKYAKLRGRIVQEYGTLGKFAAVLEIAPMTVTRKLNGHTSFTREDMIRWAVALDITRDELCSYFFE